MKTIKQDIIFDGKIEDIFDALTNGRTFSKITGGKTSIAAKEGGKFSLYDDYVTGTFVEVSNLKKIKQKWRCEDFPEKYFSDVTIELKKKGDRQTELFLTQENVPDDFYEDMILAWNEFYFEPIKDWLHDKLFG